MLKYIFHISVIHLGNDAQQCDLRTFMLEIYYCNAEIFIFQSPLPYLTRLYVPAFCLYKMSQLDKPRCTPKTCVGGSLISLLLNRRIDFIELNRTRRWIFWKRERKTEKEAQASLWCKLKAHNCNFSCCYMTLDSSCCPFCRRNRIFLWNPWKRFGGSG